MRMFIYNLLKIKNLDKCPFISTSTNDVKDVKSSIQTEIKEIRNDQDSYYRFIWIEAGSYCLTEYFLWDFLKTKSFTNYSVLYLHWLEYARMNKKIVDVFFEIKQEARFFWQEKNIKICILDHAETIMKKDEIFTLATKVKEKGLKILFIMLSKGASYKNFWHGIQQQLEQSDDKFKFPGIKSSPEEPYYVKPYSHEEIESIIKKDSDIAENIKFTILKKIDTFEECLRRPYFVTELLTIFAEMKEEDQIPQTFKDYALLYRSYKEIFDELVKNTKRTINDPITLLTNYLSDYFISELFTSHHNSPEEKNRLPIDHCAWAYGIISFYESTAVVSFFDEIFKEIKDPIHIKNIFHEILKLINSGLDSIPIISNEKIIEILQSLGNYTNIQGAECLARVLEDQWAYFEEVDLNKLFLTLCDNYTRPLKKDCYKTEGCERINLEDPCGGEYKSRFVIGKVIGLYRRY